jgi:hypothetical protein
MVSEPEDSSMFPLRWTAVVLVALALLTLVGCGGNASSPSAVDACAVPPDVPSDGALLWLRADCGVESGEDGQVSDWSSIVGSLHAAQSMIGRRPMYESDGLAGQAAIRFDGTDDTLAVGLNIHPASVPELTVITVFASDIDRPSPLRKLYGSDDGDFDRAVGLDDRAENGMNYTVFGGLRSEVFGYFALSPDTTYMTVDNYREDTFSGWVNGAETIAGTAVNNGEGLPKFYLGGTGIVFREPWKGPIAEMLVYGRSLTPEERVAVEDYLAGKYELTLTR